MNLSRNMVKWIAYLTMFVDHVGYLLFPDQHWMRIIGRIAFPIFAYLIADGMRRTRHPEKLLLRLAVFAAMSQIPFSLVTSGTPFSWGYLNIFFTLLTGAAICYFIREAEQYPFGMRLLMICLSILLTWASGPLNMDYQSYGVLLIVGFYVLQLPRCLPSRTLWVQKGIVLLFLTGMGVYSLAVRRTTFQWYALLAVLFLPYDENRPAPRHTWDRLAYAIFPAHLLLLWLVTRRP